MEPFTLLFGPRPELVVAHVTPPHTSPAARPAVPPRAVSPTQRPKQSRRPEAQRPRETAQRACHPSARGRRSLPRLQSFRRSARSVNSSPYRRSTGLGRSLGQCRHESSQASHVARLQEGAIGPMDDSQCPGEVRAGDRHTRHTVGDSRLRARSPVAPYRSHHKAALAKPARLARRYTGPRSPARPVFRPSTTIGTRALSCLK